MKIGIIGGGIAGLAAAYELQKKNHDVHIFDTNIGGLAQADGKYVIEPFYHHFFLSDKDLIALIKDLNIETKIIKKETPMGFYVNGQLYSFTSALDLLKFKPLSLSDRIKTGFLILYFQHKKSPEKLDSITVKNFMTKFHGKKIYEIIWKPLLESKFTVKAEQIPASWLWGRINPRSKSRENNKEYLCYPLGSFQIIFDALMNRIIKKGGKIIYEKIESIQIKRGKVTEITSANKKYKFDAYITTVPNPVLIKLAKLPKKYVSSLNKIEYQAAICLQLILKKSLTKYYWTNINDKRIPFSGVIEHTNFIDKSHYNNNRIVYLFNYVHQTHKYLNQDEKEIYKIYLDGLKLMFPEFNEKDIISYSLKKAKYASPIYDLNYLKKKPAFKTPIKNLFLLNTSQIYPEDRNVSHGIKYAKALVKSCF
ncbi:MAG: NAD(P)/FAD-dependent oxidoreductase [Candidatus Nanoarchaeia archaeon]